MKILVLVAVLLAIAAGWSIVRRNRARRRAAEIKAARARLRKQQAPFVSASLRGVTAQEAQRVDPDVRRGPGPSNRAA